MNDWYPTQDAKRAAFLTNFVANISEACATLQMPTDTFKVASAAAESWLECYANRQETQKRLDAALVAFQKQGSETEKHLRAAAKQIKGIINVPEPVLAQLELIASSDDPTTRIDAQTPRLTAAVELGTVVLKYKKLGHQAVQVYSCRTGEESFTLLGTYTLNRIEDIRANLVHSQPEQRQYYAIYIDKDQPNGGQSPTVSVVVGTNPMAVPTR